MIGLNKILRMVFVLRGFHVICLLLALGFLNSTTAQLPIKRNQMTYFQTRKPNSIIYDDTLYRGSREFKKLFYRTNDVVLKSLYQHHQSNKIWGGFLGTTGTIAITTGLYFAGGDRQQINRKGGWMILGGGLVSTILGGYLINRSNDNLAFAVQWFNHRHAKTKTTASIGMADNGIGLQLNW